MGYWPFEHVRCTQNMSGNVPSVRLWYIRDIFCQFFHSNDWNINDEANKERSFCSGILTDASTSTNSEQQALSAEVVRLTVKVNGPVGELRYGERSAVLVALLRFIFRSGGLRSQGWGFRGNSTGLLLFVLVSVSSVRTLLLLCVPRCGGRFQRRQRDRVSHSSDTCKRRNKQR